MINKDKETGEIRITEKGAIVVLIVFFISLINIIYIHFFI